MRGGAGSDVGTALKLAGYISGEGRNLYVANGQAVYRLTPSAMPVFSSFDIRDRAVTSNVTASTADAITIASGSIEFDTTSAASSGLSIFIHRQNGIVVSEATVPATAPIRNGRIYASIGGPVNTGLAIMNP